MNNTIVRTLSGIVFLGIMVGAILLNRYTFIILTTAIVVLGMLEFYRMTIPSAKPLPIVLGAICGVMLNLTLFMVQSSCPYSYLSYLVLGLSFVAIFITVLYEKSEKPFEQISYLILAIVYIALPFALMNLMVFSGSGTSLYNGWPLLAFFIILWANDVGAYCFGVTLGKSGKHKLFPRHSPKKSWEGFIGGVAMAMLAGYVLSILVFKELGNPFMWITMGLVVAVFATFGDLVESMLKRSVGIKDSGNIMPRHGGVLDRFDGALLSIVPAVCLFNLWELSVL